jgi:hypothetical protein
MRIIARVYFRLPARLIFLCGAMAIGIGVASWMGVFFYGRWQYETLVKESSEFGGTSISVADLITRIYIGRLVSYSVLLIGGVTAVLGIAKWLMTPYLKTQAEQDVAPNPSLPPSLNSTSSVRASEES